MGAAEAAGDDPADAPGDVAPDGATDCRPDDDPAGDAAPAVLGCAVAGDVVAPPVLQAASVRIIPAIAVARRSWFIGSVLRRFEVAPRKGSIRDFVPGESLRQARSGRREP
jgi:hypothetical protein